MSSASSSANPSASGSRGPGRGRGRGRGRGFEGVGRGRGRGRGHNTSATIELGNEPATVLDKPSRAPLTHFLALPLGHHAELRDRVLNFTSSLLSSQPAIPGLHQSMMISPRRLHLTLGVMSLTQDTADSDPGQSTPRTLQAASELLMHLRPEIMKRLDGNRLRVRLNRVDIMRPDRGDLEKAHVMWVGPSPDDEDGRRLKDICGYINQEFTKAGFVVDEKRPFKLHCTVINTVYRKPKARQRVPFSYASVVKTPAFKTIEVTEGNGVLFESNQATSTTNKSGKPRGKSPIEIDFGTWNVDEIQICEMGSWGPEGEYVSVARCSLH